MDKNTLNILVCPKCQSKLEFDKKAQELICENDQLAFPVNNGIPVMLVEEARDLSEQVNPDQDNQENNE